MSNAINIQVPVAGQPNSTEDPKIAANFAALATWLGNPGIQAADIAAGAITTAKLADSTGGSDGVTTAKIATGAVTTAKVADAAITTAKLANSSGVTDGVTTDKVATSAISSSKIRVFTRPPIVTAMPSTITATGGSIATTGATQITNLTFSLGATRPPQVGQKVTVTTSGTYLSDDTIITAVTGSGTGPYTLTLNRPTLGSGSSLAVTVAPTDGDECYYNAGSGILWHFRYKADESVYRWLFVGGPSQRSGTLPDSTGFTSTSYAAGTAGQFNFLGSGSPNFISGEFEVTLGVRHNAGAAVRAFSAPVIGDSTTWTTPSDADAAISGATSASTEVAAYLERTTIQILSTSSQSYVAFRHKLTAGTSTGFFDRNISVRPVRVT